MNENLKKVHFLIPKAKSDLRGHVESFIARNCQEKWVLLGDYASIKSIPFCSDNIYLIDEVYVGSQDDITELPVWAKLWISHTTVDSQEASKPIIFPMFDAIDAKGQSVQSTLSSQRTTQFFYFRNLYRSPLEISKAGTKNLYVNLIHLNFSVEKLYWSRDAKTKHDNLLVSSEEVTVPEITF